MIKKKIKKETVTVHDELLPSVFIPAASIRNPGAFEELRRGAYPNDKDMLTGLAEQAQIVGDDGESIYDTALMQALQPAEQIKAQRERTVGTQVLGYEVVISNDGTVQDILLRNPVGAQDARSIAASRRMAAQVPWGPKQNRSSFRQGAPNQSGSGRRKSR